MGTLITGNKYVTTCKVIQVALCDKKLALAFYLTFAASQQINVSKINYSLKIAEFLTIVVVKGRKCCQFSENFVSLQYLLIPFDKNR